MRKVDAIEFLGGRQQAAEAIGCSPQAVSSWPEVLPRRIADRVIAAAVRKGLAIPAELLDPPARAA